MKVICCEKKLRGYSVYIILLSTVISRLSFIGGTNRSTRENIWVIFYNDLKQVCGFQLRNCKDDTHTSTIERPHKYCGCLKMNFKTNMIYQQRHILNLKKIIHFHARNLNTILKQLYKKAAMQNKKKNFWIETEI